MGNRKTKLVTLAWFRRHSFRIHSLSFVDSFVTMRILKFFRVKKTQEDDASLVFLQTSVVSGALLVLKQCVTNRLCRETVSQEERVQAVVSDESEVREVWLAGSLGGGDPRREELDLGSVKYAG